MPALTVSQYGVRPLYRPEIGTCRGPTPMGSAPICDADVGDSGLIPILTRSTTREQLMARFHVRTGDGRLLSGAPAFIALWAELPGWRWLAWVGRRPGLAQVMAASCRGFLRWRPALQRWAARLDRPSPP